MSKYIGKSKYSEYNLKNGEKITKTAPKLLIRDHDRCQAVVYGQYDSNFEQKLQPYLSKRDWDILYLSDPLDTDCLGIVVNSGVNIDTVDHTQLTEQGFRVLKLNPAIVFPKTTVTGPQIYPILVFIGVLVLIIAVAWCVWTISR